MKALILAAGFGTRLMPLTRNKPKALIEIKGKPLLQHIIERLKFSGFNEIVINVHHFADQVIQFLEDHSYFDLEIEISDERAGLLDTGGGILHARKYLENHEAFLVHNVDIITNLNLKSLYNTHINSDTLATLAVKDRNTTRKLLFDEDNSLCQWENITTGQIKYAAKPKGLLSGYAFSGIHVLSKGIFNEFTESGSFSIINAYLRMAEKYRIKAYIHNQDYWFEMGRYNNVIDFNKNNNLPTKNNPLA